MLETKFLYFYLLIFSIAYPFAQSFEHRLKLYKNWKSLFLGVLIMIFIFIPWDIWFTKIGVWWFNENYISGFKIINLPIEECLFFIVVPYACVFVYEVLNYFIKKDYLKNMSKIIIIILIFLFLTLIITNYFKTYTLVVSSVALIMSLFVLIKKQEWLGRFLMMFLVCLIPFLLVNGILTGMLTKEAVVNYNPNEIIGLRIITIPVEDFIYNFSMMLIVIFFYENSKTKKKISII